MLVKLPKAYKVICIYVHTYMHIHAYTYTGYEMHSQLTYIDSHMQRKVMQLSGSTVENQIECTKVDIWNIQSR